MQRKLTWALGLMSLPLLPVPFVGALLPAIVVIVLCVTLGEMLWAPASETIFAELRLAEARGTALGLATSASWLGTALGPATALQMGAAAGELAMWALVVAFAAGSSGALRGCRPRSAGGAGGAAPPATTSSATRTRRFPTTSLRPRKSVANTTVQSTPVPTSGAITVTRPRSSASSKRRLRERCDDPVKRRTARTTNAGAAMRAADAGGSRAARRTLRAGSP